MLDLLVIGAGLAGLTAAATAAAAGLQVRVIAKGLGSMHWGAGTIDVLGYLPGSDAPAAAPLAALDQLPGEHPYRLVGTAGVATALAWFRQAMDDTGLPYLAREGGANWRLPSPIGAVRPACLAPQAQVDGDLAQSRPMVIVGFTGLRDFFPALIAENLARQGQPARAASLPLRLITDRTDSNSVHLAQALDAPAIRQRLAAELRALVQPGERIGLPAILGLDAHGDVLADLREGSGAPIFEIPTLPPSVPGIRLYQALRGHLAGQGVRIEAGMTAISHAAGEHIQWISTETSARPLLHRARSYLLATGGLLGGGLDSDSSGRLWEPIFDLPLAAPPDRQAWFRHRFLDPSGHPIFRSGVRVDAAFQPVDAQGCRRFANLWAAGAVLGGCDPIRERSLEGLAIVTGAAAAHAVVTAHQTAPDDPRLP